MSLERPAGPPAALAAPLPVQLGCSAVLQRVTSIWAFPGLYRQQHDPTGLLVTHPGPWRPRRPRRPPVSPRRRRGDDAGRDQAVLPAAAGAFRRDRGAGGHAARQGGRAAPADAGGRHGAVAGAGEEGPVRPPAAQPGHLPAAQARRGGVRGAGRAGAEDPALPPLHLRRQDPVRRHGRAAGGGAAPQRQDDDERGREEGRRPAHRNHGRWPDHGLRRRLEHLRAPGGHPLGAEVPAAARNPPGPPRPRSHLGAGREGDVHRAPAQPHRAGEAQAVVRGGGGGRAQGQEAEGGRGRLRAPARGRRHLLAGEPGALPPALPRPGHRQRRGQPHGSDQQRDRADDAAHERGHHRLGRALHAAPLLQRDFPVASSRVQHLQAGFGPVPHPAGRRPARVRGQIGGQRRGHVHRQSPQSSRLSGHGHSRIHRRGEVRVALRPDFPPPPAQEAPGAEAGGGFRHDPRQGGQGDALQDALREFRGPAGDPQDPRPRALPHLLPLHRERPGLRAHAAAPLLQERGQPDGAAPVRDQREQEAAGEVAAGGGHPGLHAGHGRGGGAAAGDRGDDHGPRAPAAGEPQAQRQQAGRQREPGGRDHLRAGVLHPQHRQEALSAPPPFYMCPPPFYMCPPFLYAPPPQK